MEERNKRIKNRDFILTLQRLCNEGMYEKAYKLIQDIKEDKYEVNIEYLELKYKVYLSTNRIDTITVEFEKLLKNKLPTYNKYILIAILGEIYFWKGQYIKAQNYLQRAFNYFKKRKDSRVLGHILYFFGYMAFQRNNYEIAKIYYSKALKEYKKFDSNKDKGRIFLMQGILSYKIGDYKHSIINLLIAHRLIRSSKQKRNNIQIRLTFGRALLMQGKLERAEKFISWALKESEEFGYKRFIALSYEFIGEIKYHQASYEEALKYLKKAKKVATNLAPRGDIAVEVYRRLGEVYVATGKYKQAQKALTQALDISESLEDRYERGAVLRVLGELSSKKGNIDIARAYFNESITTLRLIKDRLELARAYEASAKAFIDWIKAKKLKEDERKLLIEGADRNALEAVHLYSSLGISENVQRSKKLLKYIEGFTRRRVKAGKLAKIEFNSEWLYDEFIVARSASMKKALAKAKAVARSDISVMLTGETGTGKEILARYIHRMSGRKGEFIAVNCASIPETMFESEFFGHKKGAFTDARSDKAGLIETASGGTLFLDEFSELSPRQQAKLLRVLQDGKVRRIGEVFERDVDIRLVSASNGSVDSLVQNGKLRKDFYYRVCEEKIEIEPLRFRKDDISALVIYYLNKFGEGLQIEEAAIKKMERYHWPGNVRELIGAVKVLVEVASGGIVRAADLPSRIKDFGASEPTDEIVTEGVKINKLYGLNARSVKNLLSETIEKNDGNYSAAARELGISRMTLYRWLNKGDYIK